MNCPKCGSEKVEEYKQWEMKGVDFSNSMKRNVVVVKLFRCLDCEKKFRKGIPQK